MNTEYYYEPIELQYLLRSNGRYCVYYGDDGDYGVLFDSKQAVVQFMQEYRTQDVEIIECDRAVLWNFVASMKAHGLTNIVVFRGDEPSGTSTISSLEKLLILKRSPMDGIGRVGTWRQ